MQHPIHRVIGFQPKKPFVLEVRFEDGTAQMIDFRPVLRGEIYAPLRDPDLFTKVQLDAEAGTLVWPNGADFDPVILHDWPEKGQALAELASKWEKPIESRRS